MRQRGARVRARTHGFIPRAPWLVAPPGYVGRRERQGARLWSQVGQAIERVALRMDEGPLADIGPPCRYVRRRQNGELVGLACTEPSVKLHVGGGEVESARIGASLLDSMARDIGLNLPPAPSSYRQVRARAWCRGGSSPPFRMPMWILGGAHGQGVAIRWGHSISTRTRNLERTRLGPAPNVSRRPGGVSTAGRWRSDRYIQSSRGPILTK